MIFILFILSASGGQEFEAPIGSPALIEEFQNLERSPININKARRDDFLRIYWITPGLAESIVKMRNKVGLFESIEDLKNVPGMSDEIFHSIRPYITVAPELEVAPLPPVSFELRSRFQESFPREAGNWLGDPRKSYHRVKMEYKNISGVALFEKDPYEASYMDFVTYGVMVKNILGISKVVLGDYRLEFGEGLLFGFPPVITFKNQGVIKGKGRGVQLYTITGENTFLHGVALESNFLKGVKGFVFLSDAKLDAKVDSADTSIYYDYEGDYSTLSGDAKKDRVKEELFGMRIESCGFGFTWYKNSHFLNPEENKIGSHNLFSVNSSTLLCGLEWFGELGMCDDNWAGVFGTEYRKRKLKLGLLSRYYPSHFYVFHSSPWASSSSYTCGLGEAGNYLYGAYWITTSTKLLWYVDCFTKLPKPGSPDLPVTSDEYSLELQQSVSGLEITGKYRFKETGASKCKWFRVQGDIEDFKIKLRVRAEKVYENDVLDGELLYGDIGVKWLTLFLGTRLILFNSNLSQFGLYEYERDLPGLMTNQPISGKGTRVYILLKDNINPGCTISLKYAISSVSTRPLAHKYGIQLDLEI